MEKCSVMSETRCISAISRIAESRKKWRVAVETWPSASAYEGRLIFVAEDELGPPAVEGPTTFRGDTREDVLRAAYEVPEDRLRALLRSLV